MVQKSFSDEAKEKFEAAKAVIDVNERSLSFHTTAKVFPYWFNRDAADLAHIPKGILYFDPSDRKIHYVLNFKKSVVFFSIGIIGIFGAFFIFVVKGPLLTRIAIILFSWLITMFVTFIGGILGFRKFSKRLSREM